MPVSRRNLLLTPLMAIAIPRTAQAADGGAEPVAVIRRFYDDLLAVMKQAKRLSFDQRYQLLAPAVTRTIELGLMARLSVGPEWTHFRPDQQQRLTEAFSRYTISVYANRFDDFGGERFEVDPAPTTGPNGVVVASRLIKSTGEIVVINYLMRQDSAGWRVIDIYLSGTISELASRRSEFAAVLRQSGADGLIQVLEQRTAAQRTG
jgi:phospholipid transport system substrate-binding protein